MYLVFTTSHHHLGLGRVAVVCLILGCVFQFHNHPMTARMRAKFMTEKQISLLLSKGSMASFSQSAFTAESQTSIYLIISSSSGT